MWLQGGRNIQYEIQTSTNLTTWSRFSTLLITNLNGKVSIPLMDAAPISAPTFYRAVSPHGSL